MKIEAEIITFTISLMFALLGIFDYLIFAKPHYLPWIASFVALLATVGIEVVEQLCDELDGAINEDVMNELDDLEKELRDK